MAEKAFNSGKWAVQSDYGGGRSRLTQHSAPEVTRPHTKTIGACLYNVYIFDKVSLSLCLYLRFIQSEHRNQPLRLQPPVASASASIHCALESSEASSLSADRTSPQHGVSSHSHLKFVCAPPTNIVLGEKKAPVLGTQTKFQENQNYLFLSGHSLLEKKNEHKIKDKEHVIRTISHFLVDMR